MRTFQEHVAATGADSVNTIFETGMHALINELEKIISVFRAADAPFEIIGGVAVNAHLLPHHRSRSFLTRDIDLLVQRSDLERIVLEARAAGYEARRIVGGYMLRLPNQQAEEAIHLVFVGEKSKSTQLTPHPVLEPAMMELFGLRVPVAPLRDLIWMKLNSFRVKDQVHLQTLDEAGLITADVEQQLPAEMKTRLAQAREQFAAEQPDQE